MASTSLGWRGCRILSLQLVTTLLLAGPIALACRAAEKSNKQDTEAAVRLVRQAFEAEVAGDAARHAALLEQAIRLAPNYDLARWHRGEIEVDDDWQAVEDAQQAVAADQRQAEYVRLRQQVGDSPAGQLELARWCRRNDLDDEARLHWASVLSVEPNNEEAQRALGVRWFRDRLMTYAQIDQAKQQMKASQQAAKRFAPRIARWQRDIADEPGVRQRALDEIRAVKDVHAIPALEAEALEPDLSNDLQTVRARQFSLAFVAALDALPDQAATESLVRLAVLAPQEEVRREATYALKHRPPHDYVPLLMSGLAMPIESWFGVTTDPDGSVHYQHSLYREGQNTDWSVASSQRAWQFDFGGRQRVFNSDGEYLGTRLPRETTLEVAKKKAVVASHYKLQYAANANAVEQQVVRANQMAMSQNAQLIDVLERTTDQDLGENPQKWWDWWRNYNEYYESGDEPVYERYYTSSDHYYYRPPSTGMYFPPPPMSCFAAGTLVWTKTGRRPLESLEIGELVLAQNPDTGELAYKPIVGRTVRPPSDILNVKLTSGGQQEQLHTTLGHPLWVAGVGWRMAKQLGDGAVLHGVTGPVNVAAIEPADKAEAYNLVVADFNTYFVGTAGVLVHDNTPRAPTRAAVPGMVDDRVEPAADVAAK